MKALDRIECTKLGIRYFLGGTEVNKRDYRAVHPEPNEPGPTSLVRFKPLASVALEVHPDQVEEQRVEDKRRGFDVDYTKGGRPIFTSSDQMRRYCKSFGFVHRGY